MNLVFWFFVQCGSQGMFCVHVHSCVCACTLGAILGILVFVLNSLCDCQIHYIHPFSDSPFLFCLSPLVGYNLLHSVLQWEKPSSFFLSVVQFLLAQKECKPLLLQKATVWRDYAATPLQQARRHSVSLLTYAHIHVDWLMFPLITHMKSLSSVPIISSSPSI